MALYEDLDSINILRPVAQEFLTGKLTLDGDEYGGKVKTWGKEVKYDSPWIHTGTNDARLCSFWFYVLFSHYNLLPYGCMGCWKICTKLESLDQLLQVYNLQREMGLNSKCGADRREYTDCLYSAFWYGPYDGGLDGARELYARLVEAVKVIDPVPELILKRGCTELELLFGPSDQWYVPKTQLAYEQRIFNLFRPSITRSKQTSDHKTDINQRWIEYAGARGDKTYKKFRSRPFGLQPVTYHDSVHPVENFPVPQVELEWKGDQDGSDQPSKDSDGNGKGTITVI